MSVSTETHLIHEDSDGTSVQIELNLNRRMFSDDPDRAFAQIVLPDGTVVGSVEEPGQVITVLDSGEEMFAWWTPSVFNEAEYEWEEFTAITERQFNLLNKAFSITTEDVEHLADDEGVINGVEYKKFMIEFAERAWATSPFALGNKRRA